MGSEKFFKKTPFGGFNREDVLNYIEKLQEEIVSLKSELSHGSGRNTIIAPTSINKSKDVEAVKPPEENKSMSSKEIERLVAENKALKAELSEKDSEIAAYRDKLASCEEKLVSIEVKFTELEESCTKYAENEEELSAMLTRATERSESIVSQAQNEAAHIIDLAGADIITCKEELLSESDRINTAIVNFNCSAQSLRNAVDGLADKLSAAYDNITNKG